MSQLCYVQLKITKKKPAGKYTNLPFKVVIVWSRKVTGIAVGTECHWDGAEPVGEHAPACLFAGAGSCVVHSTAQLPLYRGGKSCLSPRR